MKNIIWSFLIVFIGCSSYEPRIISEESFTLDLNLTKLILEKPITLSSNLEGLCLQVSEKYHFPDAGIEILDVNSNKIYPKITLISRDKKRMPLLGRALIKSDQKICFFEIERNLNQEFIKIIELSSDQPLDIKSISWDFLSK